MAHTDKELKEATQVAYLEFIENAVKNKIADGEIGPFSIKDLIVSSIDKELLDKYPNERLQDLVQYTDMREIDKDIISRFSDDILDWKIADIHDKVSDNGFYGCVIETSPNDAIVAFRGSEGLTTYNGLVYDWMKSNFGLVNSTGTIQHKEVENYADNLSKNGVLNKYNSIDVTGHSLGGNLASHFGVAVAKKENEIFDKIDQVVNMDGPGFSDEYISNNREAISKIAPKAKHYKWSMVGSLLYDLPGEKKEFLKVAKDTESKTLLDKLKYKFFLRHHTKSIMFDENGRAERGKQDIISKGFEVASHLVEKIPSDITYGLACITNTIFSKFTYEKEDGTIGFKLPFFDKEKSKNSTAIHSGDLINNFLAKLNAGTMMFNRFNAQQVENVGFDAKGKNGINDVISAMMLDNGSYLDGLKSLDYCNIDNKSMPNPEMIR